MELAALVGKMMAKEPHRRFQTPGEVSKALTPFFKTGTNLGSRPSPEISSVGHAASSPQTLGGVSTPAPPVTGPIPAPRAPSKPDPEGVAWESLIEIGETEPSTAVVKPKPTVESISAPVRRPPWVLASLAAGVLFVALVVASVVIFRTRNGTIVFDNLPEQSVVTADGKEFTVEWTEGDGKGHAQITIPPGKHWIQVKVNGVQVSGKEVTVESRGVTQFVVRIEPAPDAAEPPLSSPPKRVKNSVGMALVLILPGEFEMGCPNGNEWGSEKPPHQVRITRPYYLGAYEVTQEQYQSLMDKIPSPFSVRPKNPVEDVSWINAVTFCNKLSERETFHCTIAS